MNQPQNTRTSTALAAVTPGFIMVAESHDGYLAIADKITKAGMMPRGFNNNQQAAIAMMAGREYGLSALQSLNGLAVVNGRAVPWGVTLRAICKSVGMIGDLSSCFVGLDEMKHAASESDEEDAVSLEMGRALRRALRRRLARYGCILADGKWSGGPSAVPANYACGFAVVLREGQPVRCELFDSKDAHQAGLLGKSGPWSQYPQRMLEARAMTFALRAAYSDRLAGLDVTADELEEVGDRAKVVVAASSALDDLAGAANPAAPPVQDAEFSERSQAHDGPPDQPEDPKARGWSNNRGDVGGRDLPGGLNNPAPAEPELTGTARGLLGMNGSDALRAVVARIRTAGGDANVYQEEACMRGIGEVKSSKAMRDDERYKVAIALAAVYDRAMTPPSERTDPTQDPPSDETPAKPAVPAEIDF